LPIFKNREFATEQFLANSRQSARLQLGRTLTVSATVQRKKAEQTCKNLTTANAERSLFQLIDCKPVEDSLNKDLYEDSRFAWCCSAVVRPVSGQGAKRG
jgi:hypothetical protein